MIVVNDPYLPRICHPPSQYLAPCYRTVTVFWVDVNNVFLALFYQLCNRPRASYLKGTLPEVDIDSPDREPPPVLRGRCARQRTRPPRSGGLW